jgi:hypothetical protein
VVTVDSGLSGVQFYIVDSVVAYLDVSVCDSVETDADEQSWDHDDE